MKDRSGKPYARWGRGGKDLPPFDVEQDGVRIATCDDEGVYHVPSSKGQTSQLSRPRTVLKADEGKVAVTPKVIRIVRYLFDRARSLSHWELEFTKSIASAIDTYHQYQLTEKQWATLCRVARKYECDVDAL